MCVCVFQYVYVYIYMFVCVSICVCMYIYIYVCVCVFQYVCIYIYMCVCFNMHIYIYINIYIYNCYINITNLWHRTSIHPSYGIFRIPGAVITGLWTTTLPKDEAILAHGALQVASACDTSLTNHGEPICWWGL